MKKALIGAFAITTLFSAIALADALIPHRRAYITEDSSARGSVYSTIVQVTGQTPERIEASKADVVTANAKVTCYKYDDKKQGTCLLNIQK